MALLDRDEGYDLGRRARRVVGGATSTLAEVLDLRAGNQPSAVPAHKLVPGNSVTGPFQNLDHVVWGLADHSPILEPYVKTCRWTFLAPVSTLLDSRVGKDETE